MKRIQKILLILPLAMSFFFIAPKASYPDDAYKVPWSENSTYVIYTTTTGQTHAFVTSSPNEPILKMTSDNWYGYRSGLSTTRYKLDGSIWSKVTTPMDLIDDYAPIPTTNTKYALRSLNAQTLLFSNTEVYTKTGTVLFHKALFQLQLTPSQIRERATQEALTQATASIWDSFGVILPIALAMLSVLLGLYLLRRLTVSAVR